MVYCRTCAAEMAEAAPFCPRCGAPQHGNAAADSRLYGPRSFTTAISLCFSRYFQSNGRAPRSEYWYFALFTFLAGILADMVDVVAFDAHQIVETIVNLGLLIPNIAVWIRRLHDLDRSGWWWLLVLVPVLGWILLIVWACTPGTPGPNRYGLDPLARPGRRGGPSPVL